MHALMIAMHAQTHRVIFDDADAARTEFKKFYDRLDEGRWSKNREEKATHLVSGPDGDHAFVVEKVEGVRLVDIDREEEVMRPRNEKSDRQHTARTIELRRALKDAGVLLATD